PGQASGRSLERIAAPFRALGCPLRNCGAFCGWLCRSLPRCAAPPDLASVCEILTGGNWVPQIVLSHPMLGAMDQAEEPALEPEEFEGWSRAALEGSPAEEIRHWLRHGCGPAGEPLERLVPVRPRATAQTIAELESRPRLAGIGRLVSRLEGALCLPPRR